MMAGTNRFKSEWLRKLSMMLAISMLLSVFYAAPPVSYADGGSNPPVFLEDFEAFEPEDYPSSFEPLTQAENYRAAVVALEEEDNNVLMMERTGASAASSYMVKSFAGSGPLTEVEIRLKAKTSQTNLIQYMPVIIGEGGGVITQLAFFENGYIRAFGPGGWVNLAPYAADQWYDIAFIMNAGAQTYDVYIDGETVVSQSPFRTEQAGLGLIRFGIQGGGSQDTGSFYVDDIAVYDIRSASPVVPDDTVFNETFDELALAEYPATFDAESAVAGNRAAVVETEESGNRALEIERFEPNNNTTYFAAKTLDEPLETALISFKAMAAQKDVIAHIPTIRGPGGAIAQISFHNNGNISVFQGSWITIQTGYDANRWYEFNIAVDAGAGKFAIFIDGEMIGDEYQFQTPQSSVSKLEFGLFRGNNTAKMYIDDLLVAASIHEPLTGISLAPEELGLAVGGKETLELTVAPEEALFYTVNWSSDNEQVATVTERGEVSGLSPGTATITAQVTDTTNSAVYTATSTVEVSFRQATAIQLDVEQATMPVGSELLLKAEISPADASNKAVEWSTTNAAVAMVAPDGRVTAVSPGSAVITATTVDGNLTASAEIEAVARSMQASYYVSEGGDDLAAGTEAAPFRTLERARDAVRALTADGLTGDVEIVLRDGLYELEDTFRLDQRDSGSNLYNIIYKAHPGEQPVISGGRTIGGWTLFDADNNIYRAPAQGIETRQLYVDGVRAVRARSDAGLTDWTLTSSGFASRDTFLADYEHPDRLEFVFQQIWTQPRAGVASVQLSEDETSIDITMKQPAWSAVTSKGGTSVNKSPVYYENAYELLDVPGEWFLDGDYFYYMPRSNENMGHVSIVAPVLEELMHIEGESLDERVHSIQFNGITFAYNTWMWPSTDWGLSDAQNNVLRYPGADDRLIEAAVTVRKGHHIMFERNTFSQIGSTALTMVEGVQDSLIRGNRFFDISGSAVTVGDITVRDPNIYAPSDPRLEMRRVDITNNYVHDIGVEYASAAAIAAGFPIDSSISNNHIFNIPYSGIHIGYGWYSYTSSGVKNLRVNDNYIHDLLGMGLYDGGAIYTVGYHAPVENLEDYNVSSGNYIENQMNRTAVLYADNASRYWHFTKNVIDFTDTPSWPNYDLYWLRGTEEELLFDHNYITAGKVNDLFGTPIPVFNTHVHPEADWPEEALNIIDNAGLEADYKDLSIEFERLFWSKTLDLQLQESQALQVSATKNKGEAADISDAIYFYRSYDETVAVADDQGVITGTGRGVTTIETQVLWGGVIRTLKSTVYVDDAIQSLEFRNAAGDARKLILGETLELDAYGLTELGQEIEFESIAYTSSDEEAVAVSADGAVIGVAEGEARITVTAVAGASEFVRTIDFEVIQYSSGQGLTRSPFYLNEMMTDVDNWKVSSGQIFFEDDAIRFITPSGQGYYAGEKYGDELFTFRMSMNASGGYQVVQIRNQEENAHLSSTYAIVFKPNEIELQRFNNGERTVIFGNVGGFTSIGGDAYPNDVFPYNETRQIQVGAVNEENGVRIILNIEGKNIFYFLDKEADRIEEDGYFSLIARYGDIVLSPAEHRVYTVVYDGNGHTGGTEPVDGNEYAQGETVTAADNSDELSKDGYVFAGWNLEPDGTGIHYEPGSSFRMGAASPVMYAQWEEEGDGSGNPGNPGDSGNPVNPGNSGSGDDSGESEDAADRLVVTEEALAAASEAEQVVVQLADEIGQVLLPAHAAELAGFRPIVITGGTVGVELPADLLLELYERLPDAEREGSYISLQIERGGETAAWEQTELHDGYTTVSPGGESLELRLSVILPDGEILAVDMIAHPLYLALIADEGADGDLLGVYRISDGGELEYEGGQWLNGMIGASVYGSGSYAALTYDRSFGDVSASHWAYADIRRLAAKHIAHGVNDTAFAPERSVTRAEFAALLARALQLPDGNLSPFADVAAEQWYAGAVASVYEAGIVAGRSKELFAPEAAITREEMAVMLIRAYELLSGQPIAAPEAEGASAFADQAQISDWATAYVESARALGVIQGHGDGNFAPQDDLTRAQSAKIIWYLFNAGAQ